MKLIPYELYQITARQLVMALHMQHATAQSRNEPETAAAFRAAAKALEALPRNHHLLISFPSPDND